MVRNPRIVSRFSTVIGVHNLQDKEQQQQKVEQGAGGGML
jgi:hypothetical protein